MRTGIGLFCQNTFDWNPDSLRGEILPASPPDWQVVEEHLRLGELAEHLGFDSVWAPEHHFTPHAMVPNPLQLLTFLAARTRRVDLGTMVVVLPWWHNPIRVAEEIAVLDIVMEGRKLFPCFGRGIAHVEYDGMGIPMGESRARQHEAIEIVRRGLTQRRFSFEGRHFTLPEMTVRPQPRTPGEDLWEQTYIAWGSPETLRFAGENGLGLLITQGTLESRVTYPDDLAGYNGARAANGWAPKYPKVVVWVLCAERREAIEEDRQRYLRLAADSSTYHYESNKPERFRGIPGYEGYLKRAEMLQATGTGDHIQIHAGGTPDDCLEQLRALQQETSAEEFILVFQYGGIPVARAQRSMRLFAREVLPVLQRYQPLYPAPAPAGERAILQEARS